MLSQKSPICSLHSPTHPLPLIGPGPVLRHIKFALPMGLSFQWWPTRPSFDTYAARVKSSGGYWLIHIAVPLIGLQTPLAPCILFKIFKYKKKNLIFSSSYRNGAGVYKTSAALFVCLFNLQGCWNHHHYTENVITFPSTPSPFSTGTLRGSFWLNHTPV